MSIASELNNLEGNIEDSYDAVNDMGGIIPAQRNMDNLDQAIRTIPQNAGITATTFHWGGSPNYSMYKDSGYTTAATYSDIATAFADGLVYIADGEDEVTYVVVSDIPDAHTITVTGIGLPDYEGGSTSYTYTSSTWTKTATEFQKKLTAGTNVQINGTTISATDTTYSDMVGATSLDAGSHGLVPAPSAGDESKVLSGAGTWVAQTAAQVNSDWNSNSGVSQILNKPSLATVATSGDYTDLINTPTIPAAQVNSDWDAASGVAQILNKPSLAAVATSGAYSDLTGTPSTFTGATSSVAGSTGLVPAPAAGDQGKVLTGGGSWTDILNVIYPVGAIYLSTNNTSPATLFGGTWEQIKDKFILAAGTTYGAGTTGGSATINLSHSHTVNSHNHSLPANTGSHTLTTAEMPSHGHDTITMSGQTLYTANNVTAYIEGHSAVRANYSNSSWERKMGTNNVGGGGGHSHSIGGNTGDKSPGTNSQLSSTQSVLPPYLAVYVWKRTA